MDIADSTWSCIHIRKDSKEGFLRVRVLRRNSVVNKLSSRGQVVAGDSTSSPYGGITLCGKWLQRGDNTYLRYWPVFGFYKWESFEDVSVGLTHQDTLAFLRYGRATLQGTFSINPSWKREFTDFIIRRGQILGFRLSRKASNRLSLGYLTGIPKRYYFPNLPFEGSFVVERDPDPGNILYPEMLGMPKALWRSNRKTPVLFPLAAVGSGNFYPVLKPHNEWVFIRSLRDGPLTLATNVPYGASFHTPFLKERIYGSWDIEIWLIHLLEDGSQ
ncbi:MAG: hypothetical protein NTX17_00925 [Candidatus Eisenbacteria bacterium]|nr:hypothetical protein [Candidatus Eisenbacteria bacterium]